MKDLARALSITKAFPPDPTDTPTQEAVRAMGAAHRKACELELASMDALELLYKMRYRTWPAGTSEALDTSAEEWDEVISRLERAVNNCRRKTPKKPTPKG